MPTFTWDNQGGVIGVSSSTHDGMYFTGTTSGMNARIMAYTAPYSATIQMNVSIVGNGYPQFFFQDSAGKIATLSYGAPNGAITFAEWANATTYVGGLGPSQVTGLNGYGTGTITIKMLDDGTNLSWFLCASTTLCEYQLASVARNSYLTNPTIMGYALDTGGSGQFSLDVVQWIPGTP
jgi:hypothetical protein